MMVKDPYSRPQIVGTYIFIVVVCTRWHAQYNMVFKTFTENILFLLQGNRTILDECQDQLLNSDLGYLRPS